MSGGSPNPTSCPPRRRTRGQEAKFLQNFHNEYKKRKNEEERSCNNKDDIVKSLEKNDFVIIDEKPGVEHNVSSSKRTKNAVKEPNSPINVVSESDDDEVEVLSLEKPVPNNGLRPEVVNSDNNGVRYGSCDEQENDIDGKNEKVITERVKKARKMSGGSSNPTSCPPRRRTRGEEAKFLQNVHNEYKKRKNEEEISCYYKEDIVKSLGKNGFVIIGEKSGVDHNVRSSKRTRNAVKEPNSPIESVSYKGDSVNSLEKNGFVIIGEKTGVVEHNVRRSKRTKTAVKETNSPINVVSESDDNEVGVLSPEKPVSNNGPRPKVANSDSHGVKMDRGRPCKNPLDVGVDFEKLTNSGSSVSDSDDMTSEEEEEDEDYRASSSESSKVITEGDERVKKVRESNKNEKVVTDGDESVEMEIESHHERDYVNANGEFQSARKSKRTHEKKGKEDEEETEGGVFEINRKNNGIEDVECYDPSAFSQKKDVKDVKSKKESKLNQKKTSGARMLDLIKVLVESINSAKEHNSQDYGSTQSALPLKFRFEDEMPQPRVKSDREMEIDSLFRDLELALLECDEINNTNSYVVENDDKDTEIDQSPAACCARGDHDHVLDEQIGIICKHCFIVDLAIKYVLPEFYTPPPGRFNHRKEPDESHSFFVDPIRFPDLGRAAPNRTQRTVWDLIPGVENELYPHQREGFEFMWNKIAGSIVIDEMKHPSTEGSGCIISHAPGTGKSRLTIIFLQTFLMMNPTGRPIIIAPVGVLLTWEAEFLKWKVNIPFHNLSKKELSENENTFASKILAQAFGETGTMSVEFKRLVKLLSWGCGRGVLGVSYELFAKLVLEDEVQVNGFRGEIKNLLLKSPGLLVLDEGHTPRNDNSKIWKALSKVSTLRRIILSGTLFQNNLKELFNTLRLVNPELEHVIEPEIKMSMTSRRIGRNLKNLTYEDCVLKKIWAMLSPLVHMEEGNFLQKSLPPLRDTLVFLNPTELQKELLEASSKTNSIFRRVQQVSHVSVHPSLMSAAEVKLPREIKPGEIESVDVGVKTEFVLKLIHLAKALGQRVLVFSQFIPTLEFIREQIKSRFSWKEGREVLFMDGRLNPRQRQNLISPFNDETSEAKVLLASMGACSEGIHLIGASRVVLLDRVWNPSVEKQAVSRAYRVGQKKAVYAYRLFTSRTEVRQYAQQIEKERMSKLLFSSTREGESCQDGETKVEESEDKILEAMLGNESFACIFEKIVRQPKESDLVEIFGLVDWN